MFTPSTMTVGELITTLRDGAFFVGLCIAGWKARGLIQPAIDFFDQAKLTMARANEHMAKMEIGMQTLLSNHIAHIEEDLRALSGRKLTHEVAEVDPLLEK